ncbi:MAG: hypothetical protein RIQ81_2569 [Pseudomonadota bacterium]|jgi:hypothetical protein
MYPGLSSLLQQLAADPSDELLAARIVALLQDIPDGEYRVDQLLAAAQMLLAASPRLGLICAHSAYRAAPERVEALAIAEEALLRLGRRAKVEVLRKERRRLQAEAHAKPVAADQKANLTTMDPAISKFLQEEATKVEHLPDNFVPGVPLSDASKGTVLLPRRDDAESGMLPINEGPDRGLEAGAPIMPGWWTRVSGKTGISANYEALMDMMGQGVSELRALVLEADRIAAMPGDSMLDAVDKLPARELRSSLLTVMVVDAILDQQAGSTIRGSDPHELVAGLLAGMLGRMPVLAGHAQKLQESVALRLPMLPATLQAGLALALKNQSQDDRPDPTFTLTTL